MVLCPTKAICDHLLGRYWGYVMVHGNNQKWSLSIQQLGMYMDNLEVIDRRRENSRTNQVLFEIYKYNMIKHTIVSGTYYPNQSIDRWQGHFFCFNGWTMVQFCAPVCFSIILAECHFLILDCSCCFWYIISFKVRMAALLQIKVWNPCVCQATLQWGSMAG